MNRKSHAGAIIGIIVVILVAAGVWWGKGYYDRTYAVNDTYYAVIPADQGAELQGMKDDDGEEFSKGYSYNLTGYDKDGTARKDITVNVYTDNADELYKPGTYLKIEMSSTRVIKNSPVQESAVPQSALSKIKNS